MELNNGINTSAQVLYNTTFTVFGSTKYSSLSKATKGSRKYKSLWYTNECEITRREIKLENKVYMKCESGENTARQSRKQDLSASLIKKRNFMTS